MFSVVEFLAQVFLFTFGVVILALALLALLDRIQTQDAIRRNYPLFGRFRGLFMQLGEFFRQYFFAMDREELPFNRAQRDWVNHSADGGSNTRAFGSTRNLSIPGTPRRFHRSTRNPPRRNPL